MSEEWRQIPGFEGLYEASSDGRIRSVQRVVSTFSARGNRRVPLRRKERLLTLHEERHGYLTVCLSRDGKCQTRRVNMLVCAAFHGPKPSGLMCCHNDGNKTNNKPWNLRWDTALANQQDRFKHGTNVNGERVGTAKLKPEAVAAIRAGMRRAEAMQAFGIGPSQFHRIKRGESWGHIEQGVRFTAPE